MVRRPQRMSRAARTARGAIGAALATILAAASHAFAGGEVSAVSVAATMIVALPFCVALAGKAASVWRVFLGVGASQFLFHWAFAGLGVASNAASAGEPGFGPHAAHFASLQQFVPDVASAASADAVMWLFHTVGAVISTILITRGEQAVLALGQTLRRALPRPLTVGMIQAPTAPAVAWEAPRFCDQLRGSLSWSLRGPPMVTA